METNALLVLTTAPSLDVANKITDLLLEKKFAACISVLPSMSSRYIWEGKICNEEEIQILIKTKASLFSDYIIPAIKSVHPYDVPEIIGLPITHGSADYLQWITAVTS